LSEDHLLPKGHPRREDPDYKVTACRFCNEAANRTSYDVAGKTPAEIVAMKKEAISRVREAYRQFWQENVEGRGRAGTSRRALVIKKHPYSEHQHLVRCHDPLTHHVEASHSDALHQLLRPEPAGLAATASGGYLAAARQ